MPIYRVSFSNAVVNRSMRGIMSNLVPIIVKFSLQIIAFLSPEWIQGYLHNKIT